MGKKVLFSSSSSSNRIDLFRISLIFSFLLLGVLGLAPEETSAFTVSPLANPPPRTVISNNNNNSASSSSSSTTTDNNCTGPHGGSSPQADQQQTTVLSAQKVDDDEALEACKEDDDGSNDEGDNIISSSNNNNLVEAEVVKRLKSRQILPVVGLVTLSSVSVAAKLGFLGQPYTNEWIAQDFGAAILTGILGYAFVKVNTYLAEKGYLDPRDSRKIIHTLSAPLFILFWPLFSPADGARYFAASVSFVNAMRLAIAGVGGDRSLAYAVSRSGNENEALGGPFLYVIILFASIVSFWRDSPVGIVALSAMAAGDGLADLFGRRYGKNNKWWFNQDKSIAGSVAFWLGGTLCASALLAILSIDLSSNLLPGANPQLLLGSIMLITALLEVIPGPFDDNWIVPLSAAVLTVLVFS